MKLTQDNNTYGCNEMKWFSCIISPFFLLNTLRILYFVFDCLFGVVFRFGVCLHNFNWYYIECNREPLTFFLFHGYWMCCLDLDCVFVIVRSVSERLHVCVLFSMVSLWLSIDAGMCWCGLVCLCEHFGFSYNKRKLLVFLFRSTSRPSCRRPN